MNPDLSKQTTLRLKSGRGIRVAIAFVAWLCSATCLRSQESAPSVSPAPAAVYVVVHIDVIPPATDGALALLKAYASACRRATGAQRFELLREAGRPNHFTLVEVWESEATRQGNEAAAVTRRFRDQLYPMLGSPWDERLQQFVQP